MQRAYNLAACGRNVAVDAGFVHTCVVTVDGKLTCFGQNDHGQCYMPANLQSVVAENGIRIQLKS